MAIAGATPMTAARLTGVAPRNAVVISGSTHRLVQGYFACLGLGMRTVKGISQPIDTYQVSHGSGARSRLEGVVSHRLTPIVGRDLEIGIMMDRWARAEEGAGQVIYISGEAGRWAGNTNNSSNNIDAGGAEPATMPRTFCVIPARISAGAAISRLCTIGAAQ